MTSPPAPYPGAVRVAVTCAAVLHAKAATLGGLDRLLRRGETALRALPVDGAGETVVAAAPLDGFELRAWIDQHCRDTEAARTLRQVAGRAALPVQSACCVAWHAVAAAGLSDRQRAETAVVIAGNNLSLDRQYGAALSHAAHPESTRAGHLLDCFDTDSLGAVGEVTGCKGEGWQIGGSSAAATLALIHASRLVASGSVRRCLVVAPAQELSPVEMTAFVRAGVTARVLPGEDPGASCRPFDEQRAGFAYAQMAAAVVVEDAYEARRRNVRELGWVLGHGVVTDGRRGTSPDAGGEAAAMRAAMRSAALEPNDIGYVNTHGTGSALGDAAEAQALRSVFGGGGRGPWVNSSKALLGHGMAAAGLVEAVATLLQLKGGYCHANPYLSTPVDPELRFVGRDARQVSVRAALSNSFAFSGINTSVVLGRLTEEEHV